MNIHTPLPATTDIQIKPTRETYDRLQQAYEHFNKALFDGTLPNALITLQRRKGTFGYFAGAKFQRDDGKPADEIALNPARFHDRSIKEILSTLVHEMVHLWQHHHGEPGRGRYHNREWAEKMKAIGLQPTDSGSEGGSETGERVSHVIIEKGLFDAAADKLLAKDFTLVWKEIPEAPVASEGEGEAQPAAPQKSGQRVRYCCPECDLKAWAKHDARLVCGDHMQPMVPKD
ncbi:SprT-like domain-containing protein [Sinorhizobium medicae]|uniref:SprT-like domain-containing protein n=1 Tax=Sinorhizobium medicae TaxID=110321 RepID=UPI002B1BDCD3|nr:SprT-like domain-containing protein [Sinorhizobium medicae]WQO45903.1 SprT-like domain-containing protein [Sinorhizobium medicae]